MKMEKTPFETTELLVAQNQEHVMHQREQLAHDPDIRTLIQEVSWLRGSYDISECTFTPGDFIGMYDVLVRAFDTRSRVLRPGERSEAAPLYLTPQQCTDLYVVGIATALGGIPCRTNLVRIF